MPKPTRRTLIKSPQQISINKLPEEIRLKVTTPKLIMPERTPRPNRLDNMIRTDKHIDDLRIIYNYNIRTLKSSTRETLEQIKRNINTTLKNIEKDMNEYSGWELSNSESVALRIMKTNFNREKAFAEQKIREIDEILKEESN